MSLEESHIQATKLIKGFHKTHVPLGEGITTCQEKLSLGHENADYALTVGYVTLSQGSLDA
jgi:hypothetical protein